MICAIERAFSLANWDLTRINGRMNPDADAN